MKKMIVLLTLVLASAAHANLDSTDYQVEPGSEGRCTTVQDIGNWGYSVTMMDVVLNDDTLNFTATIANLVCQEPAQRTGQVSWAPGVPASTPRNRTELRLAGIHAYIYEAEGFRIGQFSPLESAQQTNSFSFNWKKPELNEKLHRLAAGQSLTYKFIFGLRSSYRNRENKAYNAFSGKYGVYVTFTKQAQGEITIQKSLIRE